MFVEPELAPDIQNKTALVVTKTVVLTTTVTLSEPTTVTTTATATATVTALLPQPKMILEAPRYPAGDTTFCILFAILCVILTIAIILRKQSKKLKAFNIPLVLGAFFNALGCFLHADYPFIKKKEDIGRLTRVILTLAPIFYSMALFTIHRKTKPDATRSSMIFSCLAGLHVLYCFVAAFGDCTILFYTEQKWDEMDAAKHLAVSQVFGQSLVLFVMLGMWIRGGNIAQDKKQSLDVVESLAKVNIPSLLGALLCRVSAQFIMIIRNDLCLTAYVLLERFAEIHFVSATALCISTIISLVSQGWLWRMEWKLKLKRRGEEREAAERRALEREKRGTDLNPTNVTQVHF